MQDPTDSAEQAPPVAEAPEPIVLLPCPYLGRRQHPTLFHAYATSRNACYARPHGMLAYSDADKHHQIAVCLEPVDGWTGCRHYQSALAKRIEAPRELPPQTGGVLRTRVRRRKRHRWWRHWRATARQALYAALIILGAGLLGWLVARMGAR